MTLLFLSAIQSHHISFHDKQWVSVRACPFCHVVSAYLFSWPTVCELYYHFLLGCLTSLHPITKRGWVVLPLSPLWSLITSWPTASEWQTPCVSARQSHLISPNREWVTLAFLWMQPHHISSHYLQDVSSSVLFCHSLLSSLPMTNSLWVMLPFLEPGNLITSLPSTTSLWVTLLFFSARQCHHNSSYDQQSVSGTAPFSQIVPWLPLHLIPCLTECEWHCPFSAFSESLHDKMMNRMWVHCPFFLSSNFLTSPKRKWVTLLFSLSCSVITSHLMNRKWVKLHSILSVSWW